MASRAMIPRPPGVRTKTSNTAQNDALDAAPGYDEMGSGKTSAEEAGYMELEGAQKDADCQIVDVPDGVSSQLGCCNLFDPQQGTQVFSCGTCNYVTEQGSSGQDSDNITGAGDNEPEATSTRDSLNNYGEI